jgi:hypothetical protein
MSVIEQIHQLTLQEKLIAMEAIWDDISSVEENLEIPQWHKDILNERDQLIADGKARFIDWEEAKEQIKQAVK